MDHPTDRQNKRKRSENFSKTEEKLLVQSVKKYRHIVECKKTDSLSNKEKMMVWSKIANDFNCNTQFYRTAETLKNKYLNMKKRCKKNFAEEKRYKMGTGGGPYTSPDVSSVDMELKEILGSQVTGCSSNFDNDANSEDEEVLDHLITDTNIEWYEEDSNGNIQEKYFEETTTPVPTNVQNENMLSSGLKTQKSSFDLKSLNVHSRQEHETQSGLKKHCFENVITIPSQDKNIFSSGPKWIPFHLNPPKSKALEQIENTKAVDNHPTDKGDLMVPETTKIGREKENTGSGLKWSTGKNFSSSILKQPVSEALKPNKDKQRVENQPGHKKKCQPDPLKMKLSKWAESKSELIDMQKQYCLEEHEKRMAHLDTKHQLELQFMRAEHEAKLAKILNS